MAGYRPNKSSLHWSDGRRSLAVLMGVWLFASPFAAGQTALPDTKSTILDSYGNATAGGRERRLIGSFTSRAQRGVLRGPQNLGRRINRRGAGTSFSLPGDRGGFGLAGFGALSSGRSGGSRRGSASRSSTTRFGGFRRRATGGRPDPLSALLQRPQALTAATAMNAPVHRAQSARPSGLGVYHSMSRVPFLEAPSGDEADTESATLYEQLSEGIRQSHEQSRASGWVFFEEGLYRRAARAFEAAVMVRPDDFESRAGVVVSYLSLGAMRTALASLGALNLRDANPFAHDLNLAGHFPNELKARQLRLQTQLYAQAHQGADAAVALHVFLVWYLGERDDAMRAGRVLQQSKSKTTFASWPSKMAAALNAPTTEEPGNPAEAMP